MRVRLGLQLMESVLDRRDVAWWLDDWVQGFAMEREMAGWEWRGRWGRRREDMMDVLVGGECTDGGIRVVDGEAEYARISSAGVVCVLAIGNIFPMLWAEVE